MLHGTLQRVICIVCKKRFTFSQEHHEHFKKGEAPDCPHCVDLNATRLASNRRSIAVGTLRPDIVLYNEHHVDGDRIAELASQDMRKRPDMLLVMGTSLKVAGIRKLVKDLAKEVRSNGGKVVMVNKTAVTQTAEWKHVFDCHWVGEADEIVTFMKDQLEERDRKAAERREKRQAKLAKDQKAKENQPTLNASFKVVKAVSQVSVAVPQKKASK